MVVKSAILSLLLAASASAGAVPSNLQTIYNNVKKGGCHSFAGGKSNMNDGHGHGGFGFCTDVANAVYVSGKNSLADMDVDCDGSAQCNGESNDFQPETAFDDILKAKYGIRSLDAGIHSFSVLGTCSLDLQKTTNLKPLALVAVVCGNQLLYSVWGDTNGCDDNEFTGEASISLAKLCFPNEGLNGNNGHEARDVLYLAFTGDDAVPGPNDANWKAKSAQEFQSSLKAFGDRVLARKLGGSTTPPTTPPTDPKDPPTSPCQWKGHCLNDKCSSDDDCDGELTCKNGKCGGGPGSVSPPTDPKNPPTSPCQWKGHCLNDKCSSDDDCDGELTCKNKRCAQGGKKI